MANPEHLAILKRGVEVWNKWRNERPDVAPDLTNADLSKLSLAGAHFDFVRGALANFTECDLTDADFGHAHLFMCAFDRSTLLRADFRDGYTVQCSFRKADLRSAVLRQPVRRANFTDANLTKADLRNADFLDAILDGAVMVQSDLSVCNLRGASMSAVNVTGATTNSTIFANVDLRTVIGLETIDHQGPSTLGIDTIVLSEAMIPEVFLRGVGLSDSIIVFARSLITQPIRFYSVFISYSTVDQPFADRVYADLQSNGVRCWFAPHDIQGGKKIHDQIDEAIRVYDRLLLILSDASMNSEWVKTEIGNARQREIREKRQMLFPISLVPYDRIREWKAFDADTGKDSAREIREYFIPDFSNWKDHDSYQQALQRVLRDLKAESQATQNAE
jgi:uncharacterized protein YjbI with pentapeptide repeats